MSEQPHTQIRIPECIPRTDARKEIHGPEAYGSALSNWLPRRFYVSGYILFYMVKKQLHSISGWGSHVPLGNERRMMGGGCGEEGVVSNILAQGRPAFLVAGRPQQSLG